MAGGENESQWVLRNATPVGELRFYLTDRMMCNYLKYLEKQFVEHGGIKERMYAARTGYRKQQDRLMQQLKEENQRLQAENNRLKEKLLKLRAAGMSQ